MSFSALSPQRQLTLLSILHDLVDTITRDFLNAPARYFKTLFAKPTDGE